MQCLLIDLSRNVVPEEQLLRLDSDEVVRFYSGLSLLERPLGRRISRVKGNGHRISFDVDVLPYHFR